MKTKLLVTFLPLGLLLLTANLPAQPGGTSCTDAIVAQTGTNHANNSAGDQWFVYSTNQPKRVTISTCGLTNEDTYVLVYSGNCNSLVWIGNSDDNCGLQTNYSFDASAGVNYYIVWKNWKTSGSYDWTLTERNQQPG
ncbi:MAG: hypothetical protein ACP5PZ_10875, partial [Bacteroidales bacterium]